MVENIPGLPDNAIGFTARGTVTAHDYESVIIPGVEALLSRRDKICFLYHPGGAFEKFELAAVWDDTRLGLRHFTDWEKMAVVSDIDWVRAAIKIFGLGMPGDVRVFHNRELAEAARWISE